MTDLGSGVRVSILPRIHDHDHKAILVHLHTELEIAECEPHFSYNWRRARWNFMKDRLKEITWRDFFTDTGSGQASADSLCDLLLSILRVGIPRVQIQKYLSIHPWIDAECVEALRLKQRSVGTTEYFALRDSCSELFCRKYHQFVVSTRAKLLSLRAGSKGWWRLSNSLLNRAGSSRNTPALEGPHGWARSPLRQTCFRKRFEISQSFQRNQSTSILLSQPGFSKDFPRF